MSRSVQNEVSHLFQIDNYDPSRQQAILTTITTFLASPMYTDIMGLAIKNKASESITISSIPSLLNIIVSCLGLVDLSKKLQTKDVKYLVFGILINFISQEDAQFFDDVSYESFESLYCGLYELIMLAPEIVQIVKADCCC